MTDLRIVRASDDKQLKDWRHVHNTIIPADPLSLDEVRERSGRNHLEVAYLGETLVGCSTVRPPTQGASVVIARVLPAFRRRGFGEDLYARGLRKARELGAEDIETVVVSSNEDGLRFAVKHGFVETGRLEEPGDPIFWIYLRLNLDPR